MIAYILMRLFCPFTMATDGHVCRDYDEGDDDRVMAEERARLAAEDKERTRVCPVCVCPSGLDPYQVMPSGRMQYRCRHCGIKRTPRRLAGPPIMRVAAKPPVYGRTPNLAWTGARRTI